MKNEKRTKSIGITFAAGLIAALMSLPGAPLYAQGKPSAKTAAQDQQALVDEIAKLKAQVERLQATVEKCRTVGCPAPARTGGAGSGKTMGGMEQSEHGGMQGGKMMEHPMGGGMQGSGMKGRGGGMKGGGMEHPMGGQGGGMQSAPTPGPDKQGSAPAGDQGKPAMEQHMEDMHKHMDSMPGGGMGMPAPTAPPAAPSDSSGGMGGGMGDM